RRARRGDQCGLGHARRGRPGWPLLADSAAAGHRAGDHARFQEARVTGNDYDFIRKLLKQRSGLMLSAEKKYLVESRLMPVAQRHRISNLCELAHRLRTGADEALIAEVVTAMTTNETFFFRDRLPFDHF